MSETWRDVPGYEGAYWASDLGRVRSARTVLTPWTTNGYQVVSLSIAGVRRKFTVNRLVLLAFRGVPGERMDSCHIDGDKANNCLPNLYWGTRSQNIFDIVRHGRHKNALKSHCPAGHEYTPDNTYLIGKRTKRRQCKTCTKDKAAARYAATRKAGQAA